MIIRFSRRGFVRVISYLAAAFILVFAFAFFYARQAEDNKRALTYQYMKGMGDLATHVQNIDSDLSRIAYTTSPELIGTVSAKLWRESGFAKEVITGLPVEYLQLQRTNKFLSQVGDYCQSLAKGSAAGKQITDEQHKLLKTLNDYSSSMLSEVISAADAVQTGSVSFEKVTGNASREFDRIKAPKDDSAGFKSFEEGLTAYPTLIYDGPFSDHIMQREPRRLKGEQNIPKAEAIDRAASLLDLPASAIKEANDEDSKMPSFGFTANDAELSITKKGGLLSYMLKSRAVESSKLTPAQAGEKAEKFLNKVINLNKDGSKVKFAPTYFEISSNVITFNFACVQDDVLIYTDLIKIGIALDNGDLHSFDARGYIVNHEKRDIAAPKITLGKAQHSLSPALTVKKAQRCIIPSEGLNEIHCYEFLCRSDDGKDVLVYINSDTGKEERILILLVGENGQLTI